MYMELVECSQTYWEFVRTLRNDERVLDGFIQSTHITKEMQDTYMNQNSKYYQIALMDNTPVGYVGVIDNDIRVCTQPGYQGNGIGKFMITKCIEMWPNAFAKVKLNNTASIKLFESCGFSKKFYMLTKDD